MKNIFEIFYRFFILGLISFGGPMAHIAYFRKTFVEKLKWLDEKEYSKILALSHFLPGPSSSQVGFTIGLKKGGFLGALCAFLAFTFPSFLLLYLLSSFELTNTQNIFISGSILGLKLFAVVIISDAFLSMFKSFCKNGITIFLFALSSLLLILFSSSFMQIFVLILCAILGKIFIKNENKKDKIKISKTSKLPLFIFIFLLLAPSFFVNDNIYLQIFSSFYEVGSLVFGGGHVVLPLLEQNLNLLLEKEDFLLAYSFAQAVPGPMFTIASYLGADILKQSAFLGALIATLAIFLPGFLLILSFYKSYESYLNKAGIQSAISGVNAAVVAFLFTVLISTVAPSAIYSFSDFIFVALALFLLRKYKLSIFYLIILFILLGILKQYISF